MFERSRPEGLGTFEGLHRISNTAAGKFGEFFTKSLIRLRVDMSGKSTPQRHLISPARRLLKILGPRF